MPQILYNNIDLSIEQGENIKKKKKKKKRTQAKYDLRLARLMKRRQWEVEHGEKRQQHPVHIIGVDKGEIFILYN